MTTQEVKNLYDNNKIYEGKQFKFFKEPSQLRKNPYKNIFNDEDEIIFAIKKNLGTTLYTQNSMYFTDSNFNKHRLLYENVKTYNIDFETGKLYVNEFFIDMSYPITQKELAFYEKLDEILGEFFTAGSKSNYSFDNDAEDDFEYNAEYSYKVAENFKNTMMDMKAIYNLDKKNMVIANEDDERVQNILNINDTVLDNEIAVFFATDKQNKNNGILFTNKRVVGVFYDSSSSKAFKINLLYTKTKIEISVKDVKFKGLEIILSTDKHSYNIGFMSLTSFPILNLYLTLIQSAKFLKYYHRENGEPRYSGKLIACYTNIVKNVTKEYKPQDWEKKTDIKLMKNLGDGQLLEFKDWNIFSRDDIIKIDENKAVWHIEKDIVDLSEYKKISFVSGGNLPAFGAMRAMPMVKTDVILEGHNKNYIVNIRENDRFMLSMMLNR